MLTENSLIIEFSRGEHDSVEILSAFAAPGIVSVQSLIKLKTIPHYFVNLRQNS